MNFEQLISKYITGNLRIEELPKVGLQGLQEGKESESLLILAGLCKDDSSFTIKDYFEKTIEELDIELPDKRQAAIKYALSIVDEIINGDKEIFEGTKEIKYNALDSYDFFAESTEFAYDSIDFEVAYGLYDTYDELINADIPWSKDQTNEELMIQTKKELFEELKKWKNKISNSA